MNSENKTISSGQWMALVAAILGWLFDGFEMGLFPLVMKPALRDLLGQNGAPVSEQIVAKWEGVMHAGFLIGAATGGVLFGWLGDRLGRVRAMSLSVLTFALFSGLCGLGNSAGLVLFFRFIASLGMGGEWSLGVSLVMELWPGRSRAWLAGLIGAASNVGFILIALVSLALSPMVKSIGDVLLSSGLSQELVTKLTQNSGWRLLMLIGAFPALLTFFIRIFVPESKKWEDAQTKGATSNWAAKDLWGVAIGCLGPLGMVVAYATDQSLPVQGLAVLIGLAAAFVGYTYPVRKFLGRSEAQAASSIPGPEIMRRMYVAALLSGVALLATWGAIQRAPSWANDVRKAELKAANPAITDAEMILPLSYARAQTQIATGFGAIIGTIVAAVAGDKIGRRKTYALMCLGSLGSVALFFKGNTSFNAMFLMTGTLAGGMTASFYGWLPLYLPELFPTKVRAVGQGFAFNFGRILAGAGSLYIGYLINVHFGGKYPDACMLLSLIYLVGLVAIWFAPETKGQPLPE
ncbi:MAG: MFS transporter [Planctomycetaceae bacterium]